jgi:eukaryotic-like serine/threonine-protein kinase
MPAVAPISGLPDRYEVKRELGRGATGVVYLVIDHFAGREAALKVANAEIFQAEGDTRSLVRKAWLNEVRLAGTLKHPYIVEVYDAAVGTDYAYLIMEYLPRGTLEPYVRPDTLKSVPEVLEIAFKCASALDYACRAGIVHRDIKPANLQYIGPGEAKVADFGAAYWSKEDSTQVMDIGSLAYMAPELFRGWVTPQADIYALGVVLFQLLAGKRPFEAKDQAALMYRIVNGERTPLETLRGDLPAGVLDLVDRMLQKSPEDRCRTWPDVLAGLSALMPQLTLQTEKPAQSEMYEEMRALPLFEALNDAELWQLIRIASWHRKPAEAILLREGGEARSCYLLLDGDARVTQQGKTINFLTPGSLFGELAFAEEHPGKRSATVTASTPVTIGKWPYKSLRRASPELQTKMLQIFFRIAVERLKQADQLYHSLYQKHLAQFES